MGSLRVKSVHFTMRNKTIPVYSDGHENRAINIKINNNNIIILSVCFHLSVMLFITKSSENKRVKSCFINFCIDDSIFMTIIVYFIKYIIINICQNFNFVND